MLLHKKKQINNNNNNKFKKKKKKCKYIKTIFLKNIKKKHAYI